MANKPKVPDNPIRPNGLLNLMERDGVTQADIARAWGVADGDASQRVNGKVGITLDRARKLTAAFGWTLSEIYNETSGIDEDLLVKSILLAHVYNKEKRKGHSLDAEIRAGIKTYQLLAKHRARGEHVEPNAAITELMLQQIS